MPVTALKFSGDSKYISAGYIDGKIVVFDVNIGCMRYSIVCDEVTAKISTSPPSH